MNMDKSVKELLERYIRAVSRYLPISKRADISKEIESLVLDMCEERYNDIDIDARRMESVLVELGKPSRLAARYKETKPLIGNELMPVFKLVLLIVLLVTSVISLIEFSFNAADMNTAEIGLYFLELFSTLTSTVGTIFIVFVILERIIKNKSDIDFDDQNWQVKDLPQLSDKIPGRVEIIAGLIFSVLAIIALNLFIDKIGIYTNDSKGWTFTPILTNQIKDLLPVFSLRIALGAVVVLPFIGGTEAVSQGKRKYYFQLSQMGLTIFDIGILILLLSMGFDAFFITDAFATAGIEELAAMASKIYTGVLILLLGLGIFSLVKRTLVILPKGRV